MKVILLNGPPRCGKDTAAKAIRRHLCVNTTVSLMRFSMPIKRAFAGLMGASIDYDGAVEGYEDSKDKPIPALGRSYREWQIMFSEKFMKPLFGRDIFARLLLADVNTLSVDEPNAVVVVPDCGFQIEVDHLVTRLPKEDVLLLQIQRDGCDFRNDSREYVSPPFPTTQFRTILNGHFETYDAAILAAVRAFLDRPSLSLS